MRLYHWIQAKMFSTYEDWCLKCSSMNRHGFHIVGIENELKSMRSGTNMFVEICPPQAVEGCTSMKAFGGKTANRVVLTLEIDGKKYRRTELSYDEAARIMKAFVQKRVLPDVAEYEPTEDNPKAMADTFAALANILRVDAADAKQLRKKLQGKGAAGVDAAWEILCKKLVRSGRAVGLAGGLRRCHRGTGGGYGTCRRCGSARRNGWDSCMEQGGECDVGGSYSCRNGYEQRGLCPARSVTDGL